MTMAMQKGLGLQRGAGVSVSRRVPTSRPSVRAAANPDRPMWLPGSPPPKWLDGRWVRMEE